MDFSFQKQLLKYSLEYDLKYNYTSGTHLALWKLMTSVLDVQNVYVSTV